MGSRVCGVAGRTQQPDLLYLTLLLHDTGKGTSSENHVAGSLEVAKKCLARLDLDAARPGYGALFDRAAPGPRRGFAARYFDPETIHQIAERMVTPERLKMLCLLTYADIKAVNPEALTPWKMENIWQLYIGAANFLMRSVDERLRGDTDDELMNHLRTLAPAAGKRLDRFLNGLPRRYLRTQAASDVIRHMEMARRLDEDAVQLELTRGRHW